MPSFPIYTFDKTFVYARFLEPSGSSSVNTKQYGLPRGIYLGYDPEVTPGSMVLKLKPDARLGFSMLKVAAQSTRVQVDVLAAGDVELNFTGHTVYPVYVIGRADYQAGTPTQGRIITRATGPTGPQEVGICLVSKPAADLVVTTTVPAYRQPPLAFVNQGVGYMYGGATDDLIFAQGATAEVIKARDNLKTPPAPPAALLNDRLALDLSGEFLAAQLGLKSATVVGNARLTSAGSTFMNISDSFSEVTRQLPPIMTFAESGTETTVGAITGPVDADRNVAFLIEEATGLRLETATGGSVYGRVVYSSLVLSGTMTFTNALTTVAGVGTLFLTELQVGDLILGEDLKYYSVASIFNNTNLTLSVAYLGATFGGFVSFRRRFTLNFFSRTTGIEVAYTLAQTTNIRPFFSAWFRLDQPVFDASTFMKKVGEMPNVPSASDTVLGLVKLAVGGGLAGAIYQVTNGNSAIGANNFHTLNFTGVNASVVDAGGGVANINVPGPPGPLGPGSAVGLQGGVGPPGLGASAFNSFEISPVYGPGGTHTFNVTFASVTPPFSGDLAHVCGGIALSAVESFFFGWGGYRISGISKSGNVGTISLDLTSALTPVTGQVFLGGCA